MGRNWVRRALVVALVFAGTSVATPSTARAVGWVQLPNGNWIYQTDYTSSAAFTCSKYLAFGACHVIANGVQLTTGGSTMTVGCSL
ncbi:MAG: hypothetical protein IT359_12805 [Gemmatimonadaceae bacterium]|nr:hypothetical protein [Gemmatimonadaceae bacterium]